MVKGYCFKEKKKVEMKNTKFELNAKGRPVARGVCSSCGTNMYKILSKSETPADLLAKASGKKGGGRKSSSRKSGGGRKSRSRKPKSCKSGGGRKSRSRKSKSCK